MFQGELEDPRVRLRGARIGRGDNRREEGPDAQPIEPLIEREVKVGDDSELETAAPQSLEILAHSGQKFELHRRDVRSRELARVDRLRFELREENAGALALQGRERIGQVSFHGAACIDPSFDLEGVADRARRPGDAALLEHALEPGNGVDQADECSVCVERDGV